MGPYVNAEMKLYNIGAKIHYPAGTLVGIGGKVIEHGVEDFEGERVCVAYFMRENVMHRVGAKTEGWSTLDIINEMYSK